MLTDQELWAMFDYMTDTDATSVSKQLRLKPSEEFAEFAAEVMEGDYTNDRKPKIQQQRHIAMCVELLPFYPKKSVEYPDSIFNLLAPVFNLSPQTIRGYYYKYQKEAKNIMTLVKRYYAYDSTLSAPSVAIIEGYLNYVEKIDNQISAAE